MGRRDVALFLAVQVLKYDSSVFQVRELPFRLPSFSAYAELQFHQEEFLDIWFQSIVARRTSAQHSLTSMLLNAEQVSPLLEDLPYQRLGETGRFDIPDAKLQTSRLAALQGGSSWSAQVGPK